MENDFINFKNKENKDINSLPLISLSHPRTDPSLTLSHAKRNTIMLNQPTIASSKSSVTLKANDRLKDFLFNPDLQGKGRCHEIPDPYLSHISNTRENKGSVVRVRISEYPSSRTGHSRRGQIFLPDLTSGSGNPSGSILKNSTGQKTKFSINQSRHSIKHFLIALDAFTKQSKNKAVNSNLPS
jgi:hypothetical protein